MILHKITCPSCRQPFLVDLDNLFLNAFQQDCPACKVVLKFSCDDQITKRYRKLSNEMQNLLGSIVLISEKNIA